MSIPRDLVSRKQAFKLNELGFNENCIFAVMRKLEKYPIPGKRYNALLTLWNNDWNHTYNEYVSVPSVYQALNWLSTALKKDKNIDPFFYIGYIYIDSCERSRYTELRKLIDEKIKILISSRKKSAKKSKTKKLSKS